MMYSNDCVLAILHKGKVLRETNGEVHLPFGSNYKIRAKNNGLGRVKVKIKVDDTYIHPDNQVFVINSGDHLDLERMITDGNLKSGPKLKFVALSNGRVQDPSNKDNGVVTVEFYRETVYTRPYIYDKPLKPIEPYDGGIIYDINTTHLGSHTGGGTFDCCTTSTNYVNSDMSSGSIGCSLTTNTGGGMRTKSSKVSNGATVTGKKSSQKFSLTNDFATDYFPATLTLKIFGLDEPKFVKDTRNKFCDNCGRKNRFKAKFCSQCGRKI
jgi:hypothetical protein